MSTPRVVTRNVPQTAFKALLTAGVHPVLARVYAARGVSAPQQLDTSFNGLATVDRLKNCVAMARLLADAIAARQRLLIVADYDADGATACALGLIALQSLGAQVEYVVPNRFEYGYGLTPEIVSLAAVRQPDFLITVDNGIASVEGVEAARKLGIKVLITDHHLPAAQLPAATCIVNPNQPGCDFPSRNLAGVGVMFYVLLALRAELRARGWFDGRDEPNLADLLDLVALGTVADVVRLDDNNRILVAQGLKRIRAGRARPGIAALLRVAGRDPARVSAYDLGFILGPRLNAAGRLTDMSVGIECLLARDSGRATELAAQLDALNRERRDIEAGMQDTALALTAERIAPADAYSLSLYDESWHQGVVGILAARLRERFNRPVIAFAPGGNGEAKGSGRSIPGLHLRDALDLVSKRHPGLILRFGGHATAAGLTVRSADMAAFENAFEQTVRELLAPADLERVIQIDGGLELDDVSLPFAELLAAQVWGQGFPPPSFFDEFEVTEQKVVGGQHLKLRLRRKPAEPAFNAILFGRNAPLPSRVSAVYRVQVDEFNGMRSVQLVLDHWQPGKP
ncbi:MAG TPA: single-stranded-DNA-specific exonuclease RecJ [Burkholderiales bacterium]|jgi:single-stranded-DNA-specific exonuclease|nr:single-stranded-DNA-specific exonuclease RecJ [Burkholderiales bacterium]